MQPDWQHSINQTLGKPYQWQHFAKGSSNTLYRGILTAPDSTHSNVVLRINGPAALTPGVNRQREDTLLKALAPFNWAPAILYNHLKAGWCAMRYYQPLTQASLSHSQQQQLLLAIAQLQTIHPPTAHAITLKIDYADLWEDVYTPLIEQRQDQQAHARLTSIQQQLSRLPTLPQCLVHHDLHHGNLALYHALNQQAKDKQLILLDWEYGGIGNAWFDLAALARFFAISPSKIMELPALQWLTPQQKAQGLQQAITLSQHLDQLWHWARAPAAQAE